MRECGNNFSFQTIELYSVGTVVAQTMMGTHEDMLDSNKDAATLKTMDE